MKVSVTVLTIASLSVASGVLFQACGKPLGPGVSNLGNLQSSQLDFQVISQNILQPKCVGCHNAGSAGGGINLSTYASTMAGAVVAGNPAGSLLYTSTSSGIMPKGGPALSPVELNAISAWIQAGAVETVGAPAPAPTTSPSPSPTSTVAATFSAISANILQPKCVGCHSGSGASAGIDLSSYSQVMATAVTAGNPGSSPLYTATSGGIMPPGGGLSSADIQAIYSWINAGAQNN